MQSSEVIDLIWWLITFKGQIKVKKQSRKSRIFHLVWQITRKNPLKIKGFNRFCRSTLYPITYSCSFGHKFSLKKCPSIALVRPKFLRGVITVLLHCDKLTTPPSNWKSWLSGIWRLIFCFQVYWYASTNFVGNSGIWNSLGNEDVLAKQNWNFLMWIQIQNCWHVQVSWCVHILRFNCSSFIIQYLLLELLYLRIKLRAVVSKNNLNLWLTEWIFNFPLWKNYEK